MKKGSTLFLKFVICLAAIGALACMVWFPQAEGRAADLDIVSIYADPFILYLYIASIPFFIGLYQAFKLLNLIDANQVFSQAAVNTLKYMKYASVSLIGFIVLAQVYLRFDAHGDDITGPTMFGLWLMFGFGVIAVAAGVFQKTLQSAVDMKAENDLTV